MLLIYRFTVIIFLYNRRKNFMISQKMQQFVQNSSVIRAMFEEGKKLSAQYGAENVFDFSIGNPSIEPPAAVNRAVMEILTQEQPLAVHGYMNNSGYEEVRAAIAEHLNCLHRASLTAEQIVMTCGAAGGLNIVLKTLLNPGDEVIVFAPFFGEYANYVDNFDGKLVVVPTIPDTFLPNLSALESAVSEKTKAVIINTPNNPTGVIYSDTLLKDLCAVLEKKQREYHTDIYLISDEPYRELVYDGAAVPFLFDFFQNAVIVYSYSKSLSLPGERIGYLAVHPDSADGETLLSALNVANRILGFVNAPSLFQKTVAKILDSSVDVSAYQENRDLLYAHLTSLGFECIKPQGAFYLFPKSPIADDRAFCEIAKKYRILLVPGSSFGCPGYFRLSYCVGKEQILRSFPAFEQLAKETIQ